jgi:hypothetical protein
MDHKFWDQYFYQIAIDQILQEASHKGAFMFAFGPLTPDGQVSFNLIHCECSTT